jgi:Flp pilus assembly protein TadD
VEAFRVLAHAYRAQGDQSMAELIIGRGLKIAPDDIELHYLTAGLLMDRKETAAAIAKLKHVIRLAPTWLKVRAELAQLLVENLDWGNAVPHFEAILKEVPGDRGAKLGLAVSYKSMGRYDQAEALYQELLDKDAKDVDALWNLGMLYWREGKYDQATGRLAAFQSSVSSADKDAQRVDRILQRIEREKKNVEARRAREERERKRQEAIDAACAAVAKGRKPHAAAIGSDDERVRAAWDLLLVTAVTKIQEGDLAGGKAAAECSLAIIPDTPGPGKVACAQLRVNWVQLQDQAGLLTTADSLRRAKATIREAVACDPENPDAVLFLEQLDQLIQKAEQEERPPGASRPPGSSR